MPKLTVNSGTKRICDPDAPERETLSAALPHITYGDYGVLLLDLLDSSGAPLPVLETDVFVLSGDKDYIHNLATGALNAGITGAITAVAVKTLSATPPLTGFIICQKASDGTRERFAYSARVLNAGIYTFTVNHTLTDSFSADDVVYVEDPLMLYSGHNQFNIPGDRSDLSLPDGKISVRFDAGNPGFELKCTSNNTALILSLTRYRTGEIRGETLMKDAIYADPSLITIEGQPGTNDPEYLKAAQVQVLIDGKANQVSIFGSGPILTDSAGQQWRLVAETSGAISLEPVTT